MPTGFNWFAKLSRIKFVIIIVMAQAFLLVNASLFVEPGEVQSYRFLLMTYMVMLIGFEAFIDKGPGGASLGTGLLWFGVGLLGGSLVLSGIRWFPIQTWTFQFAQGAPIVVLVTQSVVIASSEEAIFRGYLVKHLGIVPSQVAFAAFHAAAYFLAFQNILFALVMGFVFYFVARVTNLWTAVGLHTSINLFASGVI